MELNYIIFSVISVLTIDSSKAIDIISNATTPEVASNLAMHGDKDDTFVKLPKYSVYLIGFTMIIMLIAIVLLAVALYLALKRKSIFGLNANNKQYVGQESTGVTPLYNVNYDEQDKNNGSTLTVNSGVIEISEPRPSDPVTPTRLEDVNTKVIFAKKPQGQIVPVIAKGQMDAICKEVLRKVQKSDSASYRDLNELLKFDKKDEPFGMKSEDIKESEKENKDEDKPVLKFDSPFFKLKKLQLDLQTETPKEIKSITPKEIKSISPKEIKSETENDTKLEIKDETKPEPKNETAAESENKTKRDESIDVRIEVNTVESDKNEDGSDSETEYDTVPSPIRYRHSGPEPDQEMYDTVPNPMRYRHSGPEPDQDMYDTVPNPMRYRHSGPEPDQDMYDNVPNPVRYRHSGPERDVASSKQSRLSGADTDNDDLDDIPLYDLPPRRSQDASPKTVIQMDPDSHYLVPISTEKTDSCYINAKRQ